MGGSQDEQSLFGFRRGGKVGVVDVDFCLGQLFGNLR